MKKTIFGFSALLILYAIPVYATNTPIGTFDTVDDSQCQIAGWVKDPDTTNPISVHVFKDAEFYNGGMFITSFVANAMRSDLPYTDKNHGFLYSFDSTSGLYDGNDHKIFLYGIDATGDQNIALNLSPKTIHCVSAPTSVNVKDYGAKGDGIADDAPAIQKAIAALASTGGAVNIPAGTYMLGTSAGGVENYPNGQPIQNAIILNKPNIVLHGAGSGTILKLMPHAKMRAIAATANNVTIDSVVVDGNKLQRDSGTGWPGGDVVDGLVTGFHVTNMVVQNCETRNGIEDGIGFWKSDDATVQNCYSHDNGTSQAGGAGISLSGGTRAKAIGNRVENNTATGIWSAFGSQNVSIQNNTIKNNSKGGITIGGFSVDLGAGNNSGFTISGNTISGNGSDGFDGIIVASANNGIITGNTLNNNVYDSVTITDDGINPPSTGWTITNNACSNTDLTGTQKWGIRILAKSNGIILRGNMCQNNGTGVNDQIIVDNTANVNSDWKTANTLTFGNTSAVVGGGSQPVITPSQNTPILLPPQSSTVSTVLPVPNSNRQNYCAIILRSLSFGSRGDSVIILQTFLAKNLAIYPEGLITGYYGHATMRAVRRWQAQNGIVSSGSPSTTGYGTVGPRTRAAMSAACN